MNTHDPVAHWHLLFFQTLNTLHTGALHRSLPGKWLDVWSCSHVYSWWSTARIIITPGWFKMCWDKTYSSVQTQKRWHKYVTVINWFCFQSKVKRSPHLFHLYSKFLQVLFNVCDCGHSQSSNSSTYSKLYFLYMYNIKAIVQSFC